MAISKLNFNSLNVTPTASKGIGFDSGADDLEASFQGGSMTFIKKLTASGSATLSFVDGTSGVVLDDTYKEYLFTFNNIHPAENNTKLMFQASTDTGSNYGIAMTTTRFYAFHKENGATPEFGYHDEDLAQSTDFQNLAAATGSGNDEAASGFVRIFNPSSTTFVKHFIADANSYLLSGSIRTFTAGYFNTTSAVDAVQFKMTSDNIDAGTITLYGIA